MRPLHIRYVEAFPTIQATSCSFLWAALSSHVIWWYLLFLVFLVTHVTGDSHQRATHWSGASAYDSCYTTFWFRVLHQQPYAAQCEADQQPRLIYWHGTRLEVWILKYKMLLPSLPAICYGTLSDSYFLITRSRGGCCYTMSWLMRMFHK